MATLKDWSDIILSEEDRHSTFAYENAECLACNSIERKMMRVGALVFCYDCWKSIFGTEDLDPVRNQRETYLKWLEVWRKQ